MKPMSEMGLEGENHKDGRKVYELGYLLVPTLGSEDVPAHYTALKDLITSLGGELITDEMPKFIPLAYAMTKITPSSRSKFDSAYFGWAKFFMEADKAIDLKKKVEANTKIIRFLILKTVKENTMAFRRFVGRDSAYRKHTPKKESVEATPINKEEIDKEIDAMVAM